MRCREDGEVFVVASFGSRPAAIQRCGSNYGCTTSLRQMTTVGSGLEINSHGMVRPGSKRESLELTPLPSLAEAFLQEGPQNGSTTALLTTDRESFVSDFKGLDRDLIF